MGRDDEGVNVILHIPFRDNELPKGRAQVCYLCVLRSQNLIAMQKKCRRIISEVSKEWIRGRLSVKIGQEHTVIWIQCGFWKEKSQVPFPSLKSKGEVDVLYSEYMFWSLFLGPATGTPWAKAEKGEGLSKWNMTGHTARKVQASMKWWMRGHLLEGPEAFSP